MVNQPASPSGQHAERLGQHISELQQYIAEMQVERELRSRRRQRNLLLLGGGLSVIAHLLLMLYLGLIRFGGAGGGHGEIETVGIEIAVLNEDELTQLEDVEFEPLEGIGPPLTELAIGMPTDLEVEAPSPDMSFGVSSSVPTLGGSGAGGGGGTGKGGGGGGGGTLGGGAGGTSFFGVSSTGSRFAYIVDVSASMAEDGRMTFAMRELNRSLQSLPDYASFYITLYNTAVHLPPGQENWIIARASNINNVVRWLDQFIASGGTEPGPAFQRAFALAVRPDVIFFLTDGEIPPNIADLVASLNEHGTRVVVNTIAFGNELSQDQLKRIAKESGGLYRYVPSSAP